MIPWLLATVVTAALPPTLTAQDECPWPRGHRHFCRDCGPCGTAEGDCDRDLQCRVGRTCSRNVGDDFGWWLTRRRLFRGLTRLDLAG